MCSLIENAAEKCEGYRILQVIPDRQTHDEPWGYESMQVHKDLPTHCNHRIKALMFLLRCSDSPDLFFFQEHIAHYLRKLKTKYTCGSPLRST